MYQCHAVLDPTLTESRSDPRIGDAGKQVSDVFRQDGRAVPVFNDKHLSWKWEWAKEMVEISRELNFAFTAGSSLR